VDKLSGPKRTKLGHILDRAIRSGYPLEIEISSIIKNDNWIVFSNDFFWMKTKQGKKLAEKLTYTHYILRASV